MLSGTDQVGRLKLTKAFVAVHRRGRWARGGELSLGALRNNLAETRIGFRVRRGIGGAVTRNRLRRQLRAVVAAGGLQIRPGFDLVIVIHPETSSVSSDRLREELLKLCRRVLVLAQEPG